MSEEVVIKTFLHKHEAEMAKGLLDEQRINSMILSDDCSQARQSLAFGQTIKLVVNKSDVKIATEILKVIQ